MRQSTVSRRSIECWQSCGARRNPGDRPQQPEKDQPRSSQAEKSRPPGGRSIQAFTNLPDKYDIVRRTS